MFKQTRGLFAVLIAVLSLEAAFGVFIACHQAPPNLSPQATNAWYGTRVVKALDLLRDSAIDAESQKPPLLSTATVRKIVVYHQTTVKTIHDAQTGWATGAITGLNELMKGLSPAEQAVIQPFITLVIGLLKVVPNV